MGFGFKDWLEIGAGIVLLSVFTVLLYYYFLFFATLING